MNGSIWGPTRDIDEAKIATGLNDDSSRVCGGELQETQQQLDHATINSKESSAEPHKRAKQRGLSTPTTQLAGTTPGYTAVTAQPHDEK